MMRRSLLAAAGLVFGLALAAAPASAAGKAEHPDLSGFYNATRIDLNDPIAQQLIKELPKGTVLMKDAGAYEYPSGEYGGLKPKPDVLKKAQEWSPQDELKTKNICKEPSVIYAIQGPFPMEIYQDTKLIVMKMEYFDMVRLFFMDGRGHLPEDAPHSKIGDSIAHWEGDELVVDTNHLEAATITNNGLDHSENAHFVERFRLSPDGQTLWASQYIEDPTNLENAGARIMAWKKHPGGHVYPYECDPFAYQE